MLKACDACADMGQDLPSRVLGSTVYQYQLNRKATGNTITKNPIQT